MIPVKERWPRTPPHTESGLTWETCEVQVSGLSFKGKRVNVFNQNCESYRTRLGVTSTQLKLCSLYPLQTKLMNWSFLKMARNLTYNCIYHQYHFNQENNCNDLSVDKTLPLAKGISTIRTLHFCNALYELCCYLLKIATRINTVESKGKDCIRRRHQCYPGASPRGQNGIWAKLPSRDIKTCPNISRWTYGPQATSL